jgi:hypothetical protein
VCSSQKKSFLIDDNDLGEGKIAADFDCSSFVWNLYSKYRNLMKFINWNKRFELFVMNTRVFWLECNHVLEIKGVCSTFEGRCIFSNKTLSLSREWNRRKGERKSIKERLCKKKTHKIIVDGTLSEMQCKDPFVANYNRKWNVRVMSFEPCSP